MLGGAVWRSIKHKVLSDWGELRGVVEAAYGLTKEEMLDAFYGMRPASGEPAHAFILRVEDKRARYGVDQSACYRVFTPLLSLEERQRLDLMREMAAAFGGSGPLVKWENLVERARHQSVGGKLAPESDQPSLAGFGPLVAGPALPGNVAVQQPPPTDPPRRNEKRSNALYANDLHAHTAASCPPPRPRCNPE